MVRFNNHHIILRIWLFLNVFVNGVAEIFESDFRYFRVGFWLLSTGLAANLNIFYKESIHFSTRNSCISTALFGSRYRSSRFRFLDFCLKLFNSSPAAVAGQLFHIIALVKWRITVPGITRRLPVVGWSLTR